MWPPLLLLCVMAVAEAAQHSFEKLEDVLTVTPSLTFTTDSYVGCASRCTRMTYEECTAYSFAENGTCWLYPVACLRTEPAADHPGVVSYRKPPQPTRWWPASGAVALASRCFTHHVSPTPLTWYAAQEACKVQDACSYLATPAYRLTYLTLWQFHRPNALEWIGAEDLDGDGIVKNIDGSTVHWNPPVVSHASTGPILMPDGYRHDVYRTTPTHNNVYRYICESNLRCHVGKTCPTGWFLLDQHCYKHISESRNWHDSNAHCASLGPGGQLASPWHNQLYSVLWEKFFNSNGGQVFLGGYDFGHEGSWHRLDGGYVGVSWHHAQPDNAGGIEHCLEMIGNLANDIPCHAHRQSICRVNAQPC